MMGRLFTVVGPIRNSLALDSDSNDTGLECPAFGGLRVVARKLWVRPTAERIALIDLMLRCGASPRNGASTNRPDNASINPLSLNR